MTETPEVTRVRTFIAGASLAATELIPLARELQRQKEFGLAARALQRARETMSLPPKVAKEAREQQAVSTYKNPDLPADSRNDDALLVLSEDGVDLDATRDQETLGIAGAIYKRKWEWDGQVSNLERSAGYYLRGEAEGLEGDYGYTGINAAFILDLLANLEDQERKVRPSEAARRHREQAREIRTKLAAGLPGLPAVPGNEWLETRFWFWATLGEAAFGLGDDKGAGEWLARAAACTVSDWERESTVRQLAWLLTFRVSEQQAAPGRQVLTGFLGSFPDLDAGAAAMCLSSLLRGKVGLALSGGGFRAALYHIGVLARLAEVDLLRHVEVLSCVSGGSIVGAYYYLELRRLLRRTPDAEVQPQDYLDIVRRMETEFLAGVQRNLRMRIWASLAANLKMLVQPGYCRTHRLGELYETELYSRVDDGEGAEARFLNDLFVSPKDDEGFQLKKHNWRRDHKVPQLILNATTLNTGHNWQFTASFLGEPPGAINSEVDGNERLRRAWYHSPGLTKRYQKIRLGEAVAASSCVPGLFEPLPLEGLYEGRVVRLVDGGVYDNQGVAGLLEQDCTVMLISDASGQMDSSLNPAADSLGVLFRSNAILQERVRGAQYREVAARRRAALLKGLLFVHLKKDLEVVPENWLKSSDPDPLPSNRRLTSYGVRCELQRDLSAIRTDLDVFCDLEACALMASGYRMTRHELEADHVPGFNQPVPAGPWRFLKVDPALTHPGGSSPMPKLRPVLKAATSRFFRIWKLDPALRALSVVLAVAVVAAAVLLAVTLWKRVVFTLTGAEVVLWLAGLVFGYLGLKWAVRLVNARKTLDQMLLGGVMAVVGWLVVFVQLQVFDRLYLRYGKLS